MLQCISFPYRREPKISSDVALGVDLMNLEKYRNCHYEEREQVWSQIRNCLTEEGEILDDLVREDGIARITS